MILLLLSLLSFQPHAKAQAQLPESRYTDEICEDDQKIVKEFIDLELAGQRWQGTEGKPVCLQKAKPQTVGTDRVPASDPSLLDPEFLLPDSREIHYTMKKIPDDLIEVVLNYIGKKHGKDVAVSDHFTLKKNFGKVRDIRGCASFYLEPVHFVMRSSCWSH
jgi:hypothetical protein